MDDSYMRFQELTWVRLHGKRIGLDQVRHKLFFSTTSSEMKGGSITEIAAHFMEPLSTSAQKRAVFFSECTSTEQTCTSILWEGNVQGSTCHVRKRYGDKETEVCRSFPLAQTSQ
eukprot:4354864-Amphidinium_carterae.1